MAKPKRVWRRGDKAKKADSKASAEQQMTSEELEAQQRVHGVIRTSVAAHGGLGVPWSMDDIPPPDPPAPEEDPETRMENEGRLRAAAHGGFGPELVMEKPKSKAKD